MSAPHGATHALNRGRDKDGRGRRTALPLISLLIPNRKAKHRSTGAGIVWRYELHYWHNRWYVVGRPRLRVILKALKLRK